MEKQFNRVSMLSLQELALRRVTVLLWNASSNLFSIRNCPFSSSMSSDYPKDWTGSVSYVLSKLQLPEPLANQAERISKPIGFQLIRWKMYHEAYLNFRNKYFDVPVLEKLQWTAAGSVDYRKTAEELVRCNVLDIVKRYKLACLYCLDHYIPGLWEELPHENKMIFYNEGTSHITELHLYYCWPYILKGEEHKLNFISVDPISFNEFAFRRLSSQGNKTAAEYFLQKLPPEERQNSVVSAAKSALISRSRSMNTYPSSFPNKNISDVVFYLLSEMTPEEQVQIFKERPAEVLACFFDWPWQDAFFDFSDALWNWMQCEDLESRARNYDILLDAMQRTIQKSDYYLPDLYQNVFMSSPSDFKKQFVERECAFATFFMELFDIQDTKTIDLILSNLDAGDKLKLKSSKRIFNLFYYSISRGRGGVVETFLRGVGLSKEDKVRLKEDLKEILKRMSSGAVESETPKWKKFFEFLDETDDQIKRNSGDESLTEVKKLRCE